MTILYFTATGNSLYVAKQFDGKLVSIPQAIKNGEYEFSDDAIGVVCPLYCNVPPKIVLDYLAKAKLAAGYKFMILTYGHANFGAAALAAELCNKQQFDYIRTILMVDNYLPAFDMNKETATDKKVDEQLEKLKEGIKTREKSIPKRKAGDKLKGSAFVKYFSAHPELNDGSAITVIADKCVGCGICAKVCPVGNFYLEDGVAKRKNETCEFCLACANLCTNKAIVCKYSDKNPAARYRNPNISLCEIVSSNKQTEKSI